MNYVQLLQPFCEISIIEKLFIVYEVLYDSKIPQKLNPSLTWKCPTHRHLSAKQRNKQYMTFESKRIASNCGNHLLTSFIITILNTKERIKATYRNKSWDQNKHAKYGTIPSELVQVQAQTKKNATANPCWSLPLDNQLS